MRTFGIAYTKNPTALREEAVKYEIMVMKIGGEVGTEVGTELRWTRRLEWGAGGRNREVVVYRGEMDMF